MKKAVACIAVAALTITTAPAPAAAKVSRQQLVESCRGPIDAHLPNEIAGLQAMLAEQRSEAGKPLTDAGPMTQAEIQAYRADEAAGIRDLEKQLADIRANGVEAAAMREFLDEFVASIAKASKAEIRTELAETRKASGTQAAFGVCLMEAVLADLEGRPLKAAGTSSGSSAAVPTGATATQPTHPPAGIKNSDTGSGLFPVDRVTACLQYKLLPQVAGYKYFEERNTCNYAVVVYDKVELDGEWNSYHDLNREIGPLAAAKSDGAMAKQMLVTKMAVCPAKSTLERRLGKKVTGVYTHNGKDFGCWSRLENTGVGRAN